MATWYVYLIIGIVVLVVLGLMFYASRYRRFDTSFYVIHFRGGKVIRAGQGGKAVVLPLIDEIRTIPVTTQSTFLEAKEKVVSREFQEISVTAFVFWRVVDPEVAFARVVWDQTSSAYVENIIKNATESIIRTVTANMQLEKIIRDRQAIIESVIKELHTLTRDWGLIIESVEIREIEIIDPKLKENVSGIEIINIEETENNILRVTLEFDSIIDKRPEIYKFIKSTDWILYEMHRDNVSLEAVFRNLTIEGGE